MDKELRDQLASTTLAIRRLLEDEFARQLEGVFDIFPDGRINDRPSDTLTPEQRFTRAKIVASIERRRAKGETEAESVYAYMRESAFTFLNRLAAFKMMEARGLVQECVSRGPESSGFKEFCGLAPGLTTLPDKGYQLYLESLCDEIGREVGALFTRSDSSSLLWPSRRVLEGVLATINEPSLASIWVGDETIGWIYQYYNDPEERAIMRDPKRGGSAAPRNSRELAVRNQFFTPRYVVEFLTDNTLGRIWYEMTQGETKLKEQCRYLVRRPNETFLKPGETAPDQPKQDNLSQEDLLKLAVFISHRPLKDPRTILMLDPACGSMHFGLYSFDLFEIIYDEAWALEEKAGADALDRPSGMKSLHHTYASKDAFLKDTPRLIIEQNLHGIDIDPRCAQIAGLSLWLRAQKAWQRRGLMPAKRPAIKRSNIVCAEPMPGEKELLREFVEREFPAEERALCLRLLESIFDKMQLAGEAGSLLKIEEEIRSAIEEARDAWQKLAAKPRELFTTTELNQISTAPELTGLEQAVSSLSADSRHLTTDFWERIEERIYAALRDYAEQAENGGGFQRRLFAEDAARGFAFIDVCRKRYDVALMNPPFGEPSERTENLVKSQAEACNNIFCSFVVQSTDRLTAGGAVGAITDRSFVVKESYEDFRRCLYRNNSPTLFVDLGWGVLDANVEVCCYTVIPGLLSEAGYFLNISQTSVDEKAEKLRFSATDHLSSEAAEFVSVPLRAFDNVPHSAMSYFLPPTLMADFTVGKSVSTELARTARGMSSGDTSQACRLLWEVSPRLVGPRKTWNPVNVGGGSAPFYRPQFMLFRYSEDWGALRHLPGFSLKNVDLFWRVAVGWGKRTDILSAQLLPQGLITAEDGQVAVPQNESDAMLLLGFLNSGYAQSAIHAICGGHKGPGYVGSIPFPSSIRASQSTISELASRGLENLRSISVCNETTLEFSHPLALSDLGNGNWTQCTLSRISGTLDQVKILLRQLDEAVLLSIGKSNVEQVEISKIGPGTLEPRQEWPVNTNDLVEGLVSYGLGVAFGRWDIRYATGEHAKPELPNPLAALPSCPRGQLQNEQGLPACPEDVPAAYPVHIPWDGILVDDPNHPVDIERRVREVIEIIWNGPATAPRAGGPTAESIEHEALEILGVKSLRDYFRKPTGFFADHLKRYSKSRRQAPIYWPLSSPKGLYSVWIYYHRLTADTFFTLLREVVKPRLDDEERHLFNLKQGAGPSPTPSQAREIDTSSELTEDLRAFHDEVQRIAPLWGPNLNDGVIVNHAPLWRLAPHAAWRKSLKETWDELSKGEYDWAHLAFHLWPERVIPKCATDRSLAIAHELDTFFWEEDSRSGKWVARKRKVSEIDTLIAERSSPAVKAALDSIQSAPAPSGGTAKRARKKKGD